MSEENINALIKTFHDTLPKGVANFSEKIIRAREQELEAELKRCEDDITFYGNEIAKHKAREQELLAELQEALLDDKERVNAWKAKVQMLEADLKLLHKHLGTDVPISSLKADAIEEMKAECFKKTHQPMAEEDFDRYIAKLREAKNGTP